MNTSPMTTSSATTSPVTTSPVTASSATIRSATGTTTAPERRARRLLEAAAATTAVFGAVSLVDAGAFADDRTWLPRTVGVALLVVAADVLLAARTSGRRLRLAMSVCGELAVAGGIALVVLAELGALPGAGRALVAFGGLVSLSFGVAELRAARALR